MSQLEYVPGIGGQSVQMDGPSSFVGIAENLRSREWEYDLGYRDLVSATRPAREVDVTFDADYATADDLRRVADADVTARTPGVFVAQKEWRQRGYILASNPNDIHYGRLSTELKIALLDGAWWRLVDKNFMPENTAPTYRNATGKSVTTVEAANVPLHALTVDGEAVQDGTPTPSNPVDIQVVESRNLVDFANPASVNTDGGVTFTINADGSYDVHGTATKNTYIYVTNNSSGFQLPAGSYTFSARNQDGSYPSVLRVGASRWLNGTNTSLGSASDHALTFNHDGQGNLQFIVYVNNGGTVNATVYPQLEAGSTATPYAPYGAISIAMGNTVTPIDLQGNVLASLPDGTKDVLTVDSAGHVVIEQRAKKLDTFPTFDKVISSAYTTDSYLVVQSRYSNAGAVAFPDMKVPPNATSISAAMNYFQVDVPSVTNLRSKPLFGITSNGTSLSYIWFVVPKTLANTLEEFNAWFNALTDIEFIYALKEPIYHELGYIDMPNVFDGAVVSITAEVTPTITAEWQTSPDIYLDYPHNYPYDYQKTSSTESIMPSVLTPSDVRLVIYGPAVNPYVIVGDNRYQVNVTVPSGGYVVVDGRDKTIMLTLADGTVQNVFSSGVRGGGAGGGSYIFEQVPAGTSEVTYDGSFGFDLGWYEEEGEPPWSLS